MYGIKLLIDIGQVTECSLQNNVLLNYKKQVGRRKIENYAVRLIQDWKSAGVD